MALKTLAGKTANSHYPAVVVRVIAPGLANVTANPGV